MDEENRSRRLNTQWKSGVFTDKDQFRAGQMYYKGASHNELPSSPQKTGIHNLRSNVVGSTQKLELEMVKQAESHCSSIERSMSRQSPPPGRGVLN